jgi:hypothetical protein
MIATEGRLELGDFVEDAGFADLGKLQDTNLNEAAYSSFIASHNCNYLCCNTFLKRNVEMITSGNLQASDVVAGRGCDYILPQKAMPPGRK